MAKPPRAEFDRISAIACLRGDLFDFTVHLDGLTFDCRLNDKVAGDTLYVVFNGAVDRAKYTIPVFARWNWHALFGSPILAVFDPGLHLDPALRVGWSMGTADHDATERMAAIAQHVAEQLGIAEGRVVTYGSSSGGFAAIACASRMRQGRFIAYNPQTELLRYYKGHLRDVASVFAPGRSPEQCAVAFPRRWSVIEALRATRAEGRDVRGVIAQNTVDEFHLEGHYKPFCKAFGLPPEGGTSSDGRLISALYDDPKGHGPESPDIARRVVEQYLPRILDPVQAG